MILNDFFFEYWRLVSLAIVPTSVICGTHKTKFFPILSNNNHRNIMCHMQYKILFARPQMAS